jgi:serine/threonine protein kinase
MSPQPLTESCPLCGVELDVSQFGLFSLVRCPGCSSEIRVRIRAGSFILSDLLARGGAGSVYRAVPVSGKLRVRRPGFFGALGLNWHTYREVALKVIEPGVADHEEQLSQLRNEVRCSRRVHCDRVVKVLRYEEDGEGARMAMELMPGGSLHDMVASERMLDERWLITTALDVIEALEEVSRRGMFHGDLKPANILFEDSGRAKLSDFGLAGFRRGHDGSSLGLHATPDYVAPEILEGGRGDFCSDLYGLGGCLHYGLTGHPPLATDGLALDELRELKRKAVRIPPTRTDVTPDTVALVNRMMEPDPARRFRTPREAREALLKAWDSMPASRRGDA